MRQDDRAPFDRGLREARLAAYLPGEYVEQENFMRAGEIRRLAERAGVAPGVTVLDLCCGVAGPGRFITRELGCDYLGVDASASAIAIARARAEGLRCRFAVGVVPPLPDGPFEVVLLLETMLAFPDKAALLRAVAGALVPGGRFAFTVEEGAPLTAAERAAMPDADTVWLVPLDELRDLLRRAGFAVRAQEEHTAAHRDMAASLWRSFTAHAEAMAAAVGPAAVEDLLDAHRLWIDWLGTGRVRKFAMVAERTG